MLKEVPLEVQALNPDSVLAVGGAPCGFYALPVVGPGLRSLIRESLLAVGGAPCGFYALPVIGSGLRSPIRESRCSKQYKIIL
jgi:hypothetical protein